MILIILVAVVIAALVAAVITLVVMLRSKRSANDVVSPRNAIDVITGRFTGEAEPYHGPMYATFIVNEHGARTGRTVVEWSVQLMDLDTGQMFGVHFFNQLVMGRGVPGSLSGEIAGIGTNEHISRQQYLLRGGNAVYISNISPHVPSTANGTPLTGEIPLQTGMVLEAGTTRLKVKYIGHGG